MFRVYFVGVNIHQWPLTVAFDCFRGEYKQAMTDQSMETQKRLFVVHTQIYVVVVLVIHYL